MPIKVQHDLPARSVIEKENIFIMDETRALSQDIRPLEIVLLNLMPLKEDTEIQIIRSLSNTPLQVNLTFMIPSGHKSKNTAISHLNQFYCHFDDIKDRKFDGLIVTGAPLELLDFESVDYWGELKQIMDWADNNVTSTLYLCWGAQAALYHFYGLKKYKLRQKVSGIYSHEVHHRKCPLVRGFDDVFLAPHSRYTEIKPEHIAKISDLVVLADSKHAGVFLTMSKDGKRIFVMGHPEYDRNTLDQEYKRDVKKGLNPKLPKNYYPNNNPDNKPLLTWRAHANTLYSNWLNYYVYQATPFDLNK